MEIRIGLEKCSESALISPIARLMLKSFVSFAGESDPPNTYYDRGCPWKGDGSSCPLGWPPTLRYSTFLSSCGGCALASGRGCGSPARHPPPHSLLDLPPGGTQPLRFSLPVYLLHLPLLLFHHQCPAQPPLAWLLCPFLFPSLLPFSLCRLLSVGCI